MIDFTDFLARFVKGLEEVYVDKCRELGIRSIRDQVINMRSGTRVRPEFNILSRVELFMWDGDFFKLIGFASDGAPVFTRKSGIGPTFSWSLNGFEEDYCNTVAVRKTLRGLKIIATFPEE